jgi:hypothetical protein
VAQVIDMEKAKKKMTENKAIERLKQEWNENPILVIGVFAAAVTALSKLIDSVSGIQSRRAYAKRTTKVK